MYSRMDVSEQQNCYSDMWRDTLRVHHAHAHFIGKQGLSHCLDTISASQEESGTELCTYVLYQLQRQYGFGCFLVC